MYEKSNCIYFCLFKSSKLNLSDFKLPHEVALWHYEGSFRFRRRHIMPVTICRQCVVRYLYPQRLKHECKQCLLCQLSKGFLCIEHTSSAWRTLFETLLGAFKTLFLQRWLCAAKCPISGFKDCRSTLRVHPGRASNYSPSNCWRGDVAPESHVTDMSNQATISLSPPSIHDWRVSAQQQKHTAVSCTLLAFLGQTKISDSDMT